MCWKVQAREEQMIFWQVSPGNCRLFKLSKPWALFLSWGAWPGLGGLWLVQAKAPLHIESSLLQSQFSSRLFCLILHWPWIWLRTRHPAACDWDLRGIRVLLRAGWWDLMRGSPNGDGGKSTLEDSSGFERIGDRDGCRWMLETPPRDAGTEWKQDQDEGELGDECPMYWWPMPYK
jgi:hypothetical protein